MVVPPTELEIISRLVIALILGSLIGLERELKHMPAGLRTHALVALGSSLFTVISLSFFDVSDSARIAAGVVTGIGFIGGGAIFRSEDRIKGLTTAADLWLAAAVGVAVGIGFFIPAVVTVVLAMLTLIVGGTLEKKALKKDIVD